MGKVKDEPISTKRTNLTYNSVLFLIVVRRMKYVQVTSTEQNKEGVYCLKVEEILCTAAKQESSHIKKVFILLFFSKIKTNVKNL